MPTERIDLEVSEAARELLLRHISHITEYENPIAAVLWAERGTVSKDSATKELPPHWGVGFYDPKKIPVAEVQVISGIKFVFGQGAISERLNGKLLDAENGRFVITDRAEGI
jgi:hypothetical protein